MQLLKLALLYLLDARLSAQLRYTPAPSDGACDPLPVTLPARGIASALPAPPAICLPGRDTSCYQRAARSRVLRGSGSLVDCPLRPPGALRSGPALVGDGHGWRLRVRTRVSPGPPKRAGRHTKHRRPRGRELVACLESGWGRARRRGACRRRSHEGRRRNRSRYGSIGDTRLVSGHGPLFRGSRSLGARSPGHCVKEVPIEVPVGSVGARPRGTRRARILGLWRLVRVRG